MKTIKHLFATLLLLCTTVATAHDFEVGGIYYRITDATNKTVCITYKGTSPSQYTDDYIGHVVIPESVTYNSITYSVTSIEDEAFRWRRGLTSIEIPNSVTSIGEWAFGYCEALTSIEIPNSITSISDYAIYNCTSLTSVVIPNSVTSIGYQAFRSCSSLTSIEIPNSVTSIGGWAFYDCKGLTSVVIPNSVTSIGEYAFYSCYGLEKVCISDLTAWCGIDFGSAAANPLYHANNLYLNGELLTELSIPAEIEEVNSYAFYYCESVTNIDIIDGVKSIGNDAFKNCKNLKTLYISNTIESIGDYAFANCNKIQDIKIGSKKAIAASENVFSNDAYNNACLYVPEGQKNAYEKTTPWNNFYIAEMDFTGIENVKGKSGKVKTVYDLSGRVVENPTNGIYIINGKKVLVK